MAIGYHINLEPDLAALVSATFALFPIIPPRNLHVNGNVQVLPGPGSLQTLMQVMEQAAERDFLLVVHGDPSGNALDMRLANRGDQPVGQYVTSFTLKRLMDIFNRQAIIGADAAALELREAEISHLIDLIKRLSRRRPNLVEFRNCNLGRSIEMLCRLRLILSAAWVAAPNYITLFGSLRVGTGAGLLQNHAQSHQGQTFSYPYRFQNPHGECVVCVQVNEEHKPSRGHIIADSPRTLTRWLQSYMGHLVQAGGQQDLPVYGLWDRNLGRLGDPLAIFNQPRIFFPLEFREGRHIIYA